MKQLMSTQAEMREGKTTIIENEHGEDEDRSRFTYVGQASQGRKASAVHFIFPHLFFNGFMHTEVGTVKFTRDCSKITSDELQIRKIVELVGFVINFYLIGAPRYNSKVQ